MKSDEIKKEITDEAHAKNRQYAKERLRQALEDVEHSEEAVKEAQDDFNANKKALVELEASIDAGEIKRPVSVYFCGPRYVTVTLNT